MTAEHVSPFMLHLMYNASIIYMEVNQEIQSDASAESLLILKQALGVLETRWKAAGTHQSISSAFKLRRLIRSRSLLGDIESKGDYAFQVINCVLLRRRCLNGRVLHVIFVPVQS